ncbi:hypothetical protein OXX59_000654 [Metschnikowia pulcherrima]
MWWRLPTELVDQILQHVSFDDYVSLTQTNAEARRLLDTGSQFLTVFRANFHEDIEAYEWDIDSSVSKATLWTAVRKLRRFLDLIDSLYPQTVGEPTDMGFDKHLETALLTFASQPEYFVPLIMEIRIATGHMRQNLAQALTGPALISISRISWLRKLLQLQNFLHAARFFLQKDPGDIVSVEKCYFELSRCYIDFASLARHRVKVLKQLRNEVRSLLPIPSGMLKFPSQNAYHVFLGGILKTILIGLNSTAYSSNVGANILRVYKGLGSEAQELYAAIAAKIFQEEVFSKFTFEINGVVRKEVSVAVTPVWLVFDSTYVLINLTNITFKFMEKEAIRRIPHSDVEQTFRPVTTRAVLQRAFDADESEEGIPRDITRQDWSNMYYNTSIFKLRFLRTVLMNISESKTLSTSDFRPLYHKSDFLLYFYSTMVMLENTRTEITSFRHHASHLIQPDFHTKTFAFGDLILNHSSDYFGVVLGAHSARTEDENFLVTLPFDNIEKSVAQVSSLKHLHIAEFGDSFPEFIEWLLSTDGMTYAGMLFFPTLSIAHGRLSLISEPSPD